MSIHTICECLDFVADALPFHLLDCSNGLPYCRSGILELLQLHTHSFQCVHLLAAEDLLCDQVGEEISQLVNEELLRPACSAKSIQGCHRLQQLLEVRLDLVYGMLETDLLQTRTF